MIKRDFIYEKPVLYRINFKEPGLFPKGCLTCGADHIQVQYYGDRYCCDQCMKYLQTADGLSVKLRVALDKAHITAEASQDGMIQKVKVDLDDLRLFGYKCYATFAGENGDLVVLLYDQEFNTNQAIEKAIDD